MPIFGRQQELDLTLFIDNKLIFKNPQTGRIKKVKVGFSYPVFLFDWIALLIKGLTGHGLIMLGVNIAAPIIMTIMNERIVYHYRMHGEDTETGLVVSVILCLAWLGIKICLASCANEWQANDLIKRGWILQNEEAAQAALKSENWQLGQNHISYPPPSRPKD